MSGPTHAGDANLRSSLLARLIAHAKDRPTDSACADESGRLDFRTLLEQASRVASHLRQKGPAESRLVLIASNEVGFFPWFLGALCAGWWTLPLARQVASAERSELLTRFSPTLIVDARDAVPTAYSADAPHAGGGLCLTTSGSTDRPKIVFRSQRSLDAVAANMVEAIGFNARSHVAAAVPLTHSYGIEHGLLAPIYAGSRVTLLPGLDAARIVEVLRSEIDLLPAVPAIIEQLNSMDDVRAPRCIYSAGAPLPASVEHAYHVRFGQRVGQLYGMTEIGSVTFQSPDDPHYNPASVGYPMREVSFTLDNETSELQVYAPSILERYLDEPAPLSNGRFVTGDLARVDERGRLYITGRSKLLIESAGRKINPLEVEAVLQSHPKVAACVVVALRQTATVRRLRAIIEPARVDDAPSSEELRDFARARLAGHKVPRVFQFCDRLPRSNTGKLLRSELEEK